METPYLCPDCGHEYDEPGEALLGVRVRCLDCLIEIELAFELTAVRPLAA
jgi:DNA-directed RNA polymerase subunit RPC12/RpoP